MAARRRKNVDHTETLFPPEKVPPASGVRKARTRRERTANYLVKLIRRNLGSRSRIDGIEVGVWRGETSAKLLAGIPSLCLLMVDRWQVYKKSEPSRTLKKATADHMARAMQESIRRTDFAAGRRVIIIADSVEAAVLLTPKSFDFCFLDADHSYQGVKGDLLAYLPLIKRGGLLIGHDYNSGYDKRGRFGVKRAVDEEFGDKVQVKDKFRLWWIEV